MVKDRRVQDGMDETDETDDRAFVSKALAALPAATVPDALRSRILDDFDRVAARRRRFSARFLAERAWPGVPAWQPAVALAASLIVGLALGALVPSATVSPGIGSGTGSGEQTESLVADTSPALDMLGDL